MTTTLKPVYGASSALTTTNLQSLATSSTLLAGWSSAVQDNTTNLSMDELITGTFKMGTTPTVSTIIEIWAWSILDDTPTYPDTITGTESLKTLTSTNTKLAGGFKWCESITIDATSAAVYPFAFSLANAFGGYMPKKWGLWVVHNNVVTWAASGNVITRIPLQYQNV